ncbi:MAG: hypothetical protein JSS64_00470 [Bacteroidetes bacterium]|nr:hypothetical protein [Bacteroidota bacterium]
MHNLIIAFYLFLFLTSCNQQVSEEYKLYRTDSINFITNEPNSVLMSSKNYQVIKYDRNIENKEGIGILFDNKNILYQYDLEDGQLIGCKKIPNLNEQLFYRFSLIGNNSLIISTPNKLYFLSDTILLNTQYCQQEILNNYYVYAYTNHGQINLAGNTTHLLALASKGNEAKDEASWLKVQYSLPCMGLFKSFGDSLILTDTVAFFPESFKTIYHYSKYPFTTVDHKTIAYLFEDGDSIYTYNIQTKHRKPVASLFDIDEKYFPILMKYDSIMNINYVVKNYITSSRVCFFLYDIYRKLYYLGIKQTQEYLSADRIHINDYTNYPFSLTVLDTAFHKLKSFDFPKGYYEALPINTFVARKGLYLMRKPQNSYISYEIFDFSKFIY